MGRVEKLTIRETEILTVDYTDCNPDEMIILMKKAKELILQDARPVLLLSVFNDRNRVTPKFMRQFESDYRGVEDYITKNAVIGLSELQQWILKGVNLWTKRTVLHFDTREEAIDFLLNS